MRHIGMYPKVRSATTAYERYLVQDLVPCPLPNKYDVNIGGRPQVRNCIYLVIISINLRLYSSAAGQWEFFGNYTENHTTVQCVKIHLSLKKRKGAIISPPFFMSYQRL